MYSSDIKEVRLYLKEGTSGFFIYLVLKHRVGWNCRYAVTIKCNSCDLISCLSIFISGMLSSHNYISGRSCIVGIAFLNPISPFVIVKSNCSVDSLASLINGFKGGIQACSHSILIATMSSTSHNHIFWSFKRQFATFFLLGTDKILIRNNNNIRGINQR